MPRKKIFSPKAYGLYLLEKMDRSEGDINKKMQQKGFTGDETKETIQFLKDNKFIDDKRYAENFVRNSFYKKQGRVKVAFKLKTHFISEDIITDCLDQLYAPKEDEIIDSAIKSWLDKNQKDRKMDYALKNKLVRFLLNQGFSYNKIVEKLPSISDDEFTN